jgi:HPt (histidine-containing phosphotransfer) domain-containing protein
VTMTATFPNETLEKRCMGHIEFAEDLIQGYLDITEMDLPELNRAVARGDVLKVASMAHRIKRCAAKVGAQADSEAAQKIETACRLGRLEVLSFEVDAFCRTHRETSRQFCES